jgi:hypothetical protein
MARPKRPAPVFEVLFDGKGLYPEAIPLGTLTQTLSAIRRLAAGSEPPDEDEDEETNGPDEGSIRLLDVKRGSAVFQFFSPSAKADLAHLREAGKVLETPEELGDSHYVIRPIELLSTIARRLNCALVMREAAAEKAVLATIVSTSYERLSDRLFLTGETSLTGRVERVGGATARRCALRVSFQSRMLFCRVASEEVARQLGGMLYQDVAVTGKAWWLRNSWKVVSFTIHSVYQPKPGSLEEAFQALHAAGGSGWDGESDPAAHIKEVSGQ